MVAADKGTRVAVTVNSGAILAKPQIGFYKAALDHFEHRNTCKTCRSKHITDTLESVPTNHYILIV